MSGHSKWSSIKHKKGAIDVKRGKIFTKVVKEITVAARMGGSDPDANARLRVAIDRARTVNLPKDTMERAIKKGGGELEGVNYDEIVYEGYGPEGVALIMDITTDNKNRTAAEVRQILSKRGGNLGSTNCVGWMFEKRGIITVPAQGVDEDALMELALESGALDVTREDDYFEVITAPDMFSDVLAIIKEKGLTVENAEVIRVQTSGEAAEISSREKADKIIALLEALEDNDDVTSVATNFDYTGD